ncbi:o-methyltransferase-like protein [Mollisia scopiformis]|uniref:O-methyltransferas-like protein n=1 Tax=Mollisia scopiformis TaxID=149040 RepID=A0A132B6X3_MOLSC|nr:o-methyltransferase-like protein [Mollisia scopiformis]KUJ08091.1 o-methyltransferas-like protein [Mollisia scopiformis]
MEAISAQILALAKTADQAGRRKVLDTLKSLQNEIETPYDTIWRLGGVQLQISLARVGIDLGIFEALKASEQPLGVDTLAEKNGASPELLGRILRYLASQGMIKETSKNHFTTSNLTSMLADKNYQGGIYHTFDTVGPPMAALPDFLIDTKYAAITDNTKTPFQKAFNTELPAFIWFPGQPKLFEHFQRFMTVQRAGAVSWLSVFPFKSLLGDFHGKTAFVYVGGGFGHQCIAIKETFPELSGKLELQDLPQTLQHVPSIDGVSVVVHNFFEPQPSKDAKFYYLRNILHDWPDDKALIILKNIIPAMGPDSRILIDDMVLPNENVHWHATQQDLVMMSSLGAMERTKDQWYALLEEAGLKILEIYEYTPLLNESIIVAVPK